MSAHKGKMKTYAHSCWFFVNRHLVGVITASFQQGFTEVEPKG